MPIIKCQTCGKQYSDLAPKCPFCKKTKQKKETNSPNFFKIMVTVFVTVMAITVTSTVIKDYQLRKLSAEKNIELAKIGAEKKIKEEKRAKNEAKREASRREYQAEKLKKNSDPDFIKYGEQPTISYDGKTCFEVEPYLKRALNDPESLIMSGCSTPRLIPDGWLVGCGYRARNSFGGMVRKRAFFVVKHSQVISYNEI